MHYLIYKVINNKNGKVYIGKHMTKNIDDNYMGSGTILKLAKAKYGIANFSKEILFELKTEQEMNDKEAEIVNEEFIRCGSNYNLMTGGDGGWSFVNENHNGCILGAEAVNAKYGSNRPYLKDRSWKQSEIKSFNCKFCNREIKKEGNLLQHERSCKENPNKITVIQKFRKEENIFICNCGREIRGKASFTRHTNKCKIDREVI